MWCIYGMQIFTTVRTDTLKPYWVQHFKLLHPVFCLVSIDLVRCDLFSSFIHGTSQPFSKKKKKTYQFIWWRLWSDKLFLTSVLMLLLGYLAVWSYNSKAFDKMSLDTLQKGKDGEQMSVYLQGSNNRVMTGWHVYIITQCQRFREQFMEIISSSWFHFISSTQHSSYIV